MEDEVVRFDFLVCIKHFDDATALEQSEFEGVGVDQLAGEVAHICVLNGGICFWYALD